MLIASSLSTGASKISCPLASGDTLATLKAIQAIGARVVKGEEEWTVEGTESLVGSEKPIDCGESGATLRFMIPVAALSAGRTVFSLGKSLEQRPVEPLLKSLEELGAKTSVQRAEDKTLIVVQGGGIAGGKTSIRGDVSSQFVSGLMFASPKARKNTEIVLSTPLESESYVLMTKEILAQHDIKVTISKDLRKITIPSNQMYKPRDHVVPGDFSSAAFLLAASAITRSKVTVKNLVYKTSVQGDRAIADILRTMGVKTRVGTNEIEVESEGRQLEAIEVNAKHMPDLVPVISVLACYAKGTSTICGAQRLRYKESDRLMSLYLELKKMGGDITVNEDGLTVRESQTMHGAEINPHNDHRIAMACAVAALRAEDKTEIDDAECVKKSYPNFFSDLGSLGAEIIGRKLDW